MSVTFDPRTKIFSVVVLSGMVLLSPNLMNQLMIMIMTILLCLMFGVNIFILLKKIKKFLVLFLGIIVIQSIFTNGQTDLVFIGSFTILSVEGLQLGINYMLRVLVIVFCGAIVSSSSMRNTMQGMVQLGLPYEFALMTSIGVRFLPILMDEIKQTYMAMELRGINIKKIPLRRRIELIGRLFVPIVNATLVRAKKLSESTEMRGYIIGEVRSSYYRLRFKGCDIILGLSIIIMAFLILFIIR